MTPTNFVRYYVTEKNGREVSFIVGPRLDIRSEVKAELLSINNVKIEGILSVTDRLVKSNLQYRQSGWFPWIEGKYPTEEVVFGSLMLLRHWVENEIKTIYIHCDAGSHRSPTILGFYFVAFKDYIQTIQTEPLHKEKVEGPSCFSVPLEYASSYLDRDLGEHYSKLLSLIAENYYGKNLFLEELLDKNGWEKGFPSKRV